MKKTIILLSIFCLMLISYKSMAGTCSPGGSSGSFACSAYNNESNTGIYYLNDIITYGLTFHIYANAEIDGSAYASFSWQSSGPVSFWEYVPGVSNPETDQYYYDAYVQEGYVSAYCYAYGEDIDWYNTYGIYWGLHKYASSDVSVSWY